MAVTMTKVLAEIDREEPNYPAFFKMGAAALPHLKMIAEAEDPLKAAKAAYAASIIGGAGAVDLLREASDHSDAQVRIAVAQGLQNLGKASPSELVLKALDDGDEGVRKLALRTAARLQRPEFAARVTAIQQSDPAEHLRSAAGLAAAQLAPAAPAAPAKKTKPK